MQATYSYDDALAVWKACDGIAARIRDKGVDVEYDDGAVYSFWVTVNGESFKRSVYSGCLDVSTMPVDARELVVAHAAIVPLYLKLNAQF
jgi:hypothetical protein